MALQLGMHGPAVSELQRLINEFYADDMSVADLVVNGTFDMPTRNQVVAYQTFQSLVADGVAGEVTLQLLRGNSQLATCRPFPPVHTQNVSQWTCWAESLVSFLAATRDTSSLLPDEWVGVMARRHLTGPNDGLTPSGWGAVANEIRLGATLYTDAVGPLMRNSVKREKFGADTLLSMVNTYGYLMVVYNISSTLAHTVVVSGVQLNPGYDDEHRIITMDPWRVGLTTYPFNHFSSSRVIGVLYKPKGAYSPNIQRSGPMEVPHPASYS